MPNLQRLHDQLAFLDAASQRISALQTKIRAAPLLRDLPPRR